MPPTPSPTPSISPSPTPKIVASYNGMLSGRYDISKTPGSEFRRIQESVVFGFTISPSGIVELVGMVQTGSRYAKRFTTAIDFNDHSKDQISPTLYFKQLYLQKSFQAFGLKSSAQVGALGTNQKIGTDTFVGPTTAIGTSGWSEGARLTIQTRIGDISVTGGSIYDVNQPEILRRKRELNYLEVQVTKNAFDRLTFEASGGKYDGDIFLRGAVEYDLEIVSGHVIRLIQEDFYSKNHISYSATASTDIGAIVNKKFKGRINLDLRYSYLSPDTGFRGQTINDPVLGHVFSTALYGKIDRTGRLNWFVAKNFHDVNRLQAGINWKFKGGKKK